MDYNKMSKRQLIEQFESMGRNPVKYGIGFKKSPLNKKEMVKVLESWQKRDAARGNNG